MSLVPTSSAFCWISVLIYLASFHWVLRWRVLGSSLSTTSRWNKKLKRKLVFRGIWRITTFNLFRMPPCWDVGTRWYLHRLYTSEEMKPKKRESPLCLTVSVFLFDFYFKHWVFIVIPLHYCPTILVMWHFQGCHTLLFPGNLNKVQLVASEFWNSLDMVVNGFVFMLHEWMQWYAMFCLIKFSCFLCTSRLEGESAVHHK